MAENDIASIASDTEMAEALNCRDATNELWKILDNLEMAARRTSNDDIRCNIYHVLYAISLHYPRKSIFQPYNGALELISDEEALNDIIVTKELMKHIIHNTKDYHFKFCISKVLKMLDGKSFT